MSRKEELIKSCLEDRKKVTVKCEECGYLIYWDSLSSAYWVLNSDKEYVKCPACGFIQLVEDLKV